MSKSVNELFFLRPWAIKEDVLKAMSVIVWRHMQGEKLSEEAIQAATAGKKQPSRGYEVVNGTAVIPIVGIIGKRFNLIERISANTTSTAQIEQDLAIALADDEVKNILLDIDSPGGSVSGVAELAEIIYEARKQKPIAAYANGQMASAAYWIGSAASKIYASKTAEVGSIGVYAVVEDWTVRNHNAGIKVDVIKAGRYKAAGHPDKPFTEEDRAVIQAEVNEYFELFRQAVAQHRDFSDEELDAVANGRVYIGRKAANMRLVDGIRQYNTVLKEMAKRESRAQAGSPDAGKGGQTETRLEKEPQKGGNSMDFKTLTKQQLEEECPDLVTAIKDEGKAEGREEAFEEGKAEGKKEGVKEAKEAEEKRIAGIIENMPPDMEAAALKCIKEGKSVEDSKSAFLNEYKQAAAQSPGANDEEAGAREPTTPEEKYTQEYNKDPKIQKEFLSLRSYILFRKNEDAGNVKIR